MDSEMTTQNMQKRTLDALEKRFSIAKDEVLREQEKKKKQATERSSPHSSTPISVARPIKSHLSFPSASLTSDEENWVYCSLPQTINENLMKPVSSESAESGCLVQNIWHELLKKGDSARKYTQGIKSLKVDNSILLDNLVHKHASSRVLLDGPLRHLTKRMSSRQKKALGSYDLPEKFHKFVYLEPMHNIWKQYIARLLKNVYETQASRLLLNADLHGAFVVVAECRVISFSGTRGIVIRETAETFCLITKDDRLRVVPKKGSVFIFQAGLFKVTLNGDKLAARNFCSS